MISCSGNQGKPSTRTVVWSRVGVSSLVHASGDRKAPGICWVPWFSSFPGPISRKRPTVWVEWVRITGYQPYLSSVSIYRLHFTE